MPKVELSGTLYCGALSKAKSRIYWRVSFREMEGLVEMVDKQGRVTRIHSVCMKL